MAFTPDPFDLLHMALHMTRGDERLSSMRTTAQHCALDVALHNTIFKKEIRPNVPFLDGTESGALWGAG